MRLLKQLELAFEKSTIAASRGAASIIAGRALRLPNLEKTATGAVALQFQPGRDCALEVQAGHLLHTAGAGQHRERSSCGMESASKKRCWAR